MEAERGIGMSTTLGLEELASEAETTVERVRQLVDIGAVVPAPDGTFNCGDVIRARIVSAFEAEGFSLEQMEIALREKAIDRASPRSSIRSPSTASSTR